jgi:RNA polymerase sigma-70 factor (ECF subfamily)
MVALSSVELHRPLRHDAGARDAALLSPGLAFHGPTHEARGPMLFSGPSICARARNAPVAVARRLCSDSAVKAAPGDSPAAGVAPDEGSHAAELRRRLTDLLGEHSVQVARLAFRLLGREDEVDDIVQDVFISLYRHLDRIRQTDALRAWLQTTTVRMVRRRLRVRRIGFLLRVRDRVEAPDLESPGATGEDRASLWRVHRALEQVGVNARIAWVFRYLEQESIDDVARLCGCSTSTAKRRIAEAHRAVRKALADD